MNIIKTIYKNKKTDSIVEILCNIDGKDVLLPYNKFLFYSNNVKFENAVVCKNGVIRGKNCSLNFEYKRNIITVYHGSQIKDFKPKYGLGEDKHDYGKGFYLTQNLELAKEWAVSINDREGWVHTYHLDITDLTIFNFNKVDSMCWLAELMKHRDADSSARYKRMSKLFIEKYSVDTSKYDIIYGWRADSSYFSIAKRFVRNEIDYTLIAELFHLGDLDNQICLKSKAAFNVLTEVTQVLRVDKSYGIAYLSRDNDARIKMNNLINSDRNTMQLGFDYVLRR